MGECGCNEPDWLVRFPAPEPGTWYMLEVYPGCRYCETGWAIQVQKYDPDDMDTFFGDVVPKADFSMTGVTGVWVTEIAPLPAIREAVYDVLGEDDEVRYAVDEFLGGGGLQAVLWRARRIDLT